MLKLDTPITIYPEVYDGLMIVRGEFDLRTQSVTLHLAPVQSSAEGVTLGVEEIDETGGRELRFPEIVRTVTLQQNLQDRDPRVDVLMQAFAHFLEYLEAVIVETQNDEGGLARQQHQIGVTKWGLSSTQEVLGERTIKNTVIDHRPRPEGGTPA